VNATGTITVTVFTCGTSTVSDIDGNPYNTVLIVNQCWTKENLRVRRYNEGTWIRFDNSGGSVGTTSQTWAGTGLDYGAHTIYANDSTATTGNLAVYGYLYNWYAVKGIATSGSTTYKNICPAGWHVPTDAEWSTLTTELGGEGAAGRNMKSIGTAYWSSQSSGTNNSSGFSALPGGYRVSGGSFTNVRDYALFWSATERDGSNAWFRTLYHGYGDVYRSDIIGNFIKSSGASIRCLKDL
jgi:uncharacterized protein (TIGR02145 family)